MAVFAMLNEDQAWAAVLARDPAADAELVYAVTTTGIYCRPTCPSRRPARTHVRFFADPHAAAKAGFRPCLRCRPLETHADAALVSTLTAALERAADAGRTATLQSLARSSNRSPFTIQRAFRRVLGVTPAQYQRQRRAQAFRGELAGADSRITDAIYDAGFSGPGRAYGNAQLGMAPTAYRKGAPDIPIGYATASCPLGQILIAATQRGLCAVILGASDEEILVQLHAQFPHAELHPEPALSGHLANVLTQFTPHPAALDLPFDLRATGFQMRVWEALRRIPRGETRSYAQLARDLGQPTAVRAVARACASNPVAVIIPCHRVVGSTGALTGYRWGVERKQKLLEIEACDTKEEP